MLFRSSGFQGTVKSLKTIYNPLQIPRNFGSSLLYALGSGNGLGVIKAAKAFTALPKEEKNKLWAEFVGQGLKGSSVELGQVMRQFEDVVDMNKVSKFGKYSGVAWTGNTLRNAFAFGDDFSKFAVYLNEKDRDNDYFASLACYRNGYAIQFASERIRDNKRIALYAVNSNPFSYKYLSKRLKKDKEIIKAYKISKRKQQIRWKQ